MNTRVYPFKKKKTSISTNQASLLRHLNTLRVLETLQKYGPLSRADISRITGISGPTITRTVIDLLDDKLVEEGAPIRAQLGRPGKVICLASTKVMVVGVVLERDLCHVFSSGLDGGASSDQDSFPIPNSYEALIDQLSKTIKGRKFKQSVRIMGTGVVVRALINRNDQSVSSCPDLPILEGHKLARDLVQATGYETVVVQPVLGMCFAERLYGESPDTKDYAVIDIRNGFDVAALLGGKVMTGHSGFALNFQGDDFEGENCLLAGNPSSEDIADFLNCLAAKVVLLIRLLNPEKILIASSLLQTQPDLLTKLESKVRESLPQPFYSSCGISVTTARSSDASIAAIITSLTIERKHSIR